MVHISLPDRSFKIVKFQTVSEEFKFSKIIFKMDQAFPQK